MADNKLSTGVDHEHNAAIELAARWLATTPRHARGDGAIVPILRQRFGLTSWEAIQAVKESHLIRGRAL